MDRRVKIGIFGFLGLAYLAGTYALYYGIWRAITTGLRLVIPQ